MVGAPATPCFENRVQSAQRRFRFSCRTFQQRPVPHPLCHPEQLDSPQRVTSRDEQLGLPGNSPCPIHSRTLRMGGKPRTPTGTPFIRSDLSLAMGSRRTCFLPLWRKGGIHKPQPAMIPFPAGKRHNKAWTLFQFIGLRAACSPSGIALRGWRWPCAPRS